MSEKVWIAGGGVISGIGLDIPACIQSFRDMQPGMTAMQHLSSVHRNTFPVAEVKADNATLADLQWILHAYLMEAAYREVLLQPLFFDSLIQVYEAGHIPCGWDGEWPNGQLVIC